MELAETPRRFCWSCGAALASAPPVECAACGRQHWRNASPAAAGLVTRDDRLLLVRRALEPWRGAWCAPAGFCDGDEHPIATAEREIYEESGVRARVVGFLGIWTDEYGNPAPDEEPELISVAYYNAKPLDEAAGVPDPAETSEVGWFSFDALPPAGDLAPPKSFPRALAAWRKAHASGAIVTPLFDRP